MRTAIQLSSSTLLFLSLFGCGLATSAAPGIASDAFGPDLQVNTPARGTHLSQASTVTVTGEAGDGPSSVSMYLSRWGGVQLSGNTPADYPFVEGTTDASDAFSLTVPTRFGTNLLQTMAVDSVGLRTHDTRAVLVGGLLDDGIPVPDAFVLRIDDSPEGLGVLESVVERELAAMDLSSFVSGPIYSACDPVFCSVSLEAFVGDIRYGDVDVIVDPRADGTLRLQVSMDDLNIPWYANANAGNNTFFTEDGTVSAGEITVTIDFRPEITGGQFSVQDLTVDLDAADFDVDVTNALFGVIEDLGVDFDGRVYAALSETVEGMGATIAERIVTEFDALPNTASFDLPEYDAAHLITIPVLETATYPNSIEIGDDYLMMSMSAEVNTPFSDMGGSLYRNTYWPSTGSNGWGRDEGMGMAVNLNYLNQILHVVRAGDMLDVTVPLTTFDVDPSAISIAFPGINNPMVTLETHLDPVIVPCDTSIGEVCPPRRVPFDSDNLDAVLQMGAVRAVLRDGNGRLRCDAWMSVVMDVGLDFSGNQIVTTTGAPQIWLDVIEPSATDETVQAVLEHLILSQVSQLTYVLDEIRVPTFAGIGVQFSSSGMFEGTDMYGIGGTLQVLPGGGFTL